MTTRWQILLVTGILLPLCSFGWTSPQSRSDNSNHGLLSRRDYVTSAATAVVLGTVTSFPLYPTIPVHAAEEDNSIPPQYRYEKRDRNMNKDAIFREDYWYAKGVTPPRKLNSPLVLDDPKWNAFGSCETSGDKGGSNSCTYISLKQRQPAYSKYGFTITLAAQEFQQLGKAIEAQDWNRAATLVFTNPKTNLPPPTVDALLKMVLFASAMLTSPNYSGSSRELLVARFYVNELNFALKEIGSAIEQKDGARAKAAWEFGKDSFNSYSQVVNRQISPKVGEPFPLIV